MLFVDVGSYENEKNIFEIFKSIQISKFFSISSPIELFFDAHFELF